MCELSIIIPTYNRSAQLRNCLEALSRQSQPPTDFEDIVVIDGSTDNTRFMLTTLKTSYSLNIIYQKNSGANNARNRGVNQAKGSYCLFIDDDIIPGSKLVREHLQFQRTHKGVVGIGHITLKVPTAANWFVHAFARGWSNHYNNIAQNPEKISWMDCYGGNFSLPRGAFLEVGGFAQDLPRSHDIELGYRLAQKGMSFVYIPTAIGCQDERKSVRSLTTDAERSGATWAKIWQRHPPTLPELLGMFGEASFFELILRRLFCFLKVSPCLLVLFGRLLSKPDWINRWQRFIVNYSYWRGAKRSLTSTDTAKRLVSGIPILTYHAFSRGSEPASRYVIDEHKFTNQMAWLKRMRYSVLSLSEYIRLRLEYRLPPTRSVVVTFDDGYADNLRIALPILRRYGFSATIFLVSGRVGATNDWAHNNGLINRHLLSWDDIKKMQDEGIDFGAHSRTHLSLLSLTAEKMQNEIRGAKNDLECKLSVPINYFAYPYGEFNSTIKNFVEQSGYNGACSVEWGLNTLRTSLFKLRRIEVFGTDSPIRFLFKLRFGGGRILSRRRFQL